MTLISSSNPTDWLLHWFQQRNPGVAITIQSNYHEEELIDSFAFIELLDDIETELGLRLDFADLADVSIQTVGGLAALLERKA